MPAFLTHLECGRCGASHDASVLQNLCRDCGGPLLARYDLAGVRRAVTPEELRRRPRGLWRFAELLPVAEAADVLTLGEGDTPLLPLAALGQQLGLSDLWIKDEGLNPTGTFKARGAAVGVSAARRRGARTLALPTAGNAGGAWAAYARRAGLECVVAMPVDAPLLTKQEVLAAGGRLHLVEGLISDAGRWIAERAPHEGWFEVATLKEPYRIEGKKTMGLEIAEAFGWAWPDVIVYPTGGGVGLIGIWKAMHELEELGWVRGHRPRLVAVQAAGCAPIVRAFEQGLETSEFWQGADTIAAGLRVPKALGDFLVLRAIRETGGTAVAVDDEAIRAMLQLAGRTEGLLLSPESAAAFAGAAQLRRDGWLRGDERVVVLSTGSGLKYPHVLPQPA